MGKQARKERPRPNGLDICKPCWELHYCPYGALVEFMPFPAEGPVLKAATLAKRFSRAEREMRSQGVRTADDVFHWAERFAVSDPDSVEYVARFEPEELGCRVFGHTCPVFFHASHATETKSARSKQRSRYIPRGVMMKVVRRDNYTCQACRVTIRDEDVQFDHLIPYSKGGATTVNNIRLICSDCNRRKSDALEEILEGPRTETAIAVAPRSRTRAKRR